MNRPITKTVMETELHYKPGDRVNADFARFMFSSMIRKMCFRAADYVDDEEEVECTQECVLRWTVLDVIPVPNKAD